jgi:photosystem II stability/assembly factor-like uncharacterized protein
MNGTGTDTGTARETARRRGPDLSRGRGLITAACVSVLLTGCGTAAAAGGGTAAEPAQAPVAATTGTTATPVTTTAAATPATTGRAHDQDEYLDRIDLTGPGFGLVALGTGPQGTGRARLVESSDFGRSFTVIGARTAAGTIADDVFFLGREDGWYAVYNLNTSDELVYRTTNGGRSWSAFAAPGHVLADTGTRDALQFLTPARGWLTDTQDTGPVEALYTTTDGGGRWRLVARTAWGSHGPGVLPTLGQVRFEPGGKVGWLGGGACSNALYRTVDGGRAWQRSGIPAPAGSAFGLPAAFGPTLLESVTLGNGTLVLYRSSDDGSRWSRVSALPHAVAGAAGCYGSTVSVSFPTAQDGWAAAAHGGRTVAYRTTDGGRHWELARGTLPGQSGTSLAPDIQATDANRAWLQTPGDQLYTTVDGGATWRRIDGTAIAAGS